MKQTGKEVAFEERIRHTRKAFRKIKTTQEGRVTPGVVFMRKELDNLKFEVW